MFSKILSLGVSAATLAAVMATSAVADEATAEIALTRDDVREIIREYIQQNPAEIVAAVEEYITERQELERQKAWERYMVKAHEHRDELLAETGTTVLGNPDASISVVYFQDFNCVHCRSMSETISHLLENEDDVRVLNRYMPIFGEGSQLAAAYALATQEVAPESLGDVHKAFYETRGQIEVSNIHVALSNTLDEETLSRISEHIQDTDNSEKISGAINYNLDLARSMGISGTPFFAMFSEDDHVVIPGAIDQDSFMSAVSRLKAAKED